jgi:RHS repeat-associated protein
MVSVLLVVALGAGFAAAPPAVAAEGESPEAGLEPSEPGEVPELRTQTSKTIKLDDGRLRTVLSLDPVHYRDETGRWIPIDSRLVPSDQAGYEKESAANNFRALFKASSEPGFLRFERGAVAAELSLDDAGRASGRAEAASMRYAGVMPGVDLLYDVLPSGVKETVVLARRGTPSSFDFTLQPNSPLRQERSGDGSWAFYTPAGEAAFRLATPFAVDAQGARSHEAVSLKVTPAANGAFIVSLDISDSWLRDPKRAFPVSVDPTIDTLAATQNADFPVCTGCTGYETGDTWVGTSDTYAWRSAFQFDLAGLPAGADITNAAFELNYDKNCIFISDPINLGCGREDHVLDLHPMTAPWTAASTADQLQYSPTKSASDTLAVTEFLQPQVMKWDVTSAVRGWHYGETDNFGWLLKRSSEQLGKSGPMFPSAHYGETTVPDVRPRLTVTHNEGVTLKRPLVLRSNGAHLQWTPYAGYSGALFERYEVHRGSFQGFSLGYGASFSTLLTTIADPARTSFIDTTAAAGQTFYYRVVVFASGVRASSNDRMASLPAVGTAQMWLQPEPVDGAVTQITGASGQPSCANHGAAPSFQVGATPAGTARALVRFDVRDIPADAQVTSAKVVVTPTTTAATPAMSAHELTAGWAEGAGLGECSEDGATWLYHDAGDLEWDVPGGDLNTAALATSQAAGGGIAFTVTDAVQRWVSGTTPNNGVLLRAADETGPARTFAADDYTVNPNLRPRLEVSFVDNNTPRAPTVELIEPAQDTVLRGATWLSAEAHDDRRVMNVDFYLDDGSQQRWLASDSTWPYRVSWNPNTSNITATCPTADSEGRDSAASLNASTDEGTASRDCGPTPLDRIYAVATDEVGNRSPAESTDGATHEALVRIVKGDPPATDLRLPLDGSTVKGAAVPVTGSVLTAAGLKAFRVELLLDGRIIDSTTGSAFNFTWNTLDPKHRAYDGNHTLTVRAFDSIGQTSQDSITVKVDNTTGTKYQAAYTTSGIPKAITFDRAGVPATHPITVTVKNTSPLEWRGSLTHLHLEWFAAKPTSGSVPTAIATAAPRKAFDDPSTPTEERLAPGGSKTFQVNISPPPMPQTVDANTYRLRIDVEETIPGLPVNGAAANSAPHSRAASDTNEYVRYSAAGMAPAEQLVPVCVTECARHGLERYFHYTGAELGGGMQQLVNVATGNSLVRFSPFASPGRGLNSLIDLTYNSRRGASTSPVGHGFTLSGSGLLPIGSTLDIQPPASSDPQAGKHYIAFTDGDGTLHTFYAIERGTGTGKRLVWDAPAGVHLYLREFSSQPISDRKYAITKPDRVTFFFDQDGWPTYVRDGNGNELKYVYIQAENAAVDPGKPAKQLVEIRDAAYGDALLTDLQRSARTFKFAYYTAVDTLNPHVRGQLKTITDHNGSQLGFNYYEDGNLRRLTQVGARLSDADPYLAVADRRWTFTYTTSDLSGPAISDPALRLNPDERTPNQSNALYSVRDPRGRETRFEYKIPATNDTRGQMVKSTDPADVPTSYEYGTPESPVTTVTAPPGASGQARVSKFTYNADASVTAITKIRDDQANIVTDLTWGADRHLRRLYEPRKASDPATVFTEYDYDDNGYVRSVIDQEGHTTRLDYDHLDAGTTTAASGVTGDRDTTDNATYWRSGRTMPHVSQLAAKTAPEGVVTTRPNAYRYDFSYDIKGNLWRIKDPPLNPALPDQRPETLLEHNTDGTVKKATDANGNPTSYLQYDRNGFPTVVSDALGRVTRTVYDDDGQLTSVLDPRHAADVGKAPHANYRMMFTYDTFGRMRRRSEPKSSTIYSGTLLYSGTNFDPNDNPVQQLQGNTSLSFGPEKITTYRYHAKTDLLIEVRNPQGEKTALDYDPAGRLTRQTRPRGVASTLANDYSTSYSYDALDQTTRMTRHQIASNGTDTPVKTDYCYDVVGNTIAVIAPNAGDSSRTCDPAATRTHTTTMRYDNAHRLLERTDAEGNAETYGYDHNSNVTSVTNAEAETTRRDYNDRDELVAVKEPLIEGAPAVRRDVVTRYEYDGVGNVTRVVHPRGYDAAGPSGPFDLYTTVYKYDGANQLERITLPSSQPATDTTTSTGDKVYVHRRYDANGNLNQITLPTDKALLADVAAEDKTKVTHLDPGWVHTSDTNLAATNDPDPVNTYDYEPEGWQASRTYGEKTADGNNITKTTTWKYYPDGQLLEISDEKTNRVTYTYDANNNPLTGESARAHSGYARSLRYSHDQLDRSTLTRERENRADGHDRGNWRTTTFAYDLNGNIKTRIENIVQKPDANFTQVKAGREHTFTYLQNDRLATHLDAGPDSSATATGDDRYITTTFDAVGRQTERVVKHRPASSIHKQRTAWTWFDNGKLNTLSSWSVNSAGTETLKEQHGVDYTDGGTYLNGNRVSDTYARTSTGTGAKCTSFTAKCVATYRYDPRDRLTEERPYGDQARIEYTLNPAGSITIEKRYNSSNVLTNQTDYDYRGAQLNTVKAAQPNTSIPARTQRYFYDIRGNLDCVALEITGTTLPANICSKKSDDALYKRIVANYAYDYLDQLMGYRSFQTDGTTQRRDAIATYTYDALQRTDTSKEQHFDSSDVRTSARTTEFSYLGMTGNVASEKHTEGIGSTAGPLQTTKSYGYNAWYQRIAMTDANTDKGTTNYLYNYDVHGSVSQLIQDGSGPAGTTTETGSVRASYGYRGYGEEDTNLSKGDVSSDNPTNSYRYAGKRYDSGSGQLDMGARRFSPDTRRFLQDDKLDGAFANLGLGTDPLTSNRYSLAGGNPVSFVEVDGHRVGADGLGGAVYYPPTNAPRATSGGDSASSSIDWGTGPDLVTVLRRAGNNDTPVSGSDQANSTSAAELERRALAAAGIYPDPDPGSSEAPDPPGNLDLTNAARGVRLGKLATDTFGVTDDVPGARRLRNSALGRVWRGAEKVDGYLFLAETGGMVFGKAYDDLMESTPPIEDGCAYQVEMGMNCSAYQVPPQIDPQYQQPDSDWGDLTEDRLREAPGEMLNVPFTNWPFG